MSLIAQVFALNFMGILWGFVGINLIRKGIPTIFFNFSAQAGCLLVALALVIGFCKSYFLIKKTANRLVQRADLITGFSNVYKILDKKAVIFLSMMMGLAFLMKATSGLEITKSIIRVAVGYALLQSSFYFFKPAFLQKLNG
jgi:divalent metal cation (Fe/Co/Zn/Cd) transporter